MAPHGIRVITSIGKIVGLLLLGAVLAAACSPPDRAKEIENLITAGRDFLASDPELAIGHFRQVLALDPTHGEAALQLASALDQIGRREEARPFWEKAAVLAEAAGDQETLRTARARLHDLPPPLEAEQARLMREGLNLLYTQRKPDTAAERFAALLQLKPAHYGATYQLAAALQAAGRTAEAAPVWDKAMELAVAYKDEKTIALIKEKRTK